MINCYFAPILRTLIFTVVGFGITLQGSAQSDWLQQPPDFTALGYANNTFVIGGKRGEIFTSSDGFIWHSQVSPTTNSLNGIAFGANKFVAVGDNGTILTSLDAQEWVLQDSHTLNNINGVAFGNGVFAAVGNGPVGQIRSSEDGISWVERADSVITLQPFKAVSFGKTEITGRSVDLFIAVGQTIGHCYYSEDGKTWSSTPTGTTATLNGITYGDGAFVAGGYASNAAIIRSVNGLDWTTQTSLTAPNPLRGLGFGNHLFVAVGDYSQIETSPDGILWTHRHTPNEEFHELFFTSVAYGNNVFVAVGRKGIIFTSANGDVWTPEYSSPAPNLAAAVFGNMFVATGFRSNTNSPIQTSADGILWTDRESATKKALNGIAFGDNRYVIAGDGIFLTSDDAINWATQNSIRNANLGGVAFGNGRFMAAGPDPALPFQTSLQTSADGVQWVERIVDLGVFRAVAYGNNLFVMVSSEGVVTSPDGVKWTKRFSDNSLPLTTVAYGNNTFVAIGFNPFSAGKHGIIVTSTDGVNWAPQALGLFDYLTGVTFGDGKFVAVGYGSSDVVITSANGKDWTAVATPLFTSPQAVTFGRGRFVSVGQSGILNGGQFQDTTSVEPTCVPVPPGLISWWRAEGNAFDSIGQNNGTYLGNAAANRPAIDGLGFVFDGQSGIEIPNRPSLQPANVSVEAWVLLHDLDNPDSTVPGLQYIVFKRNSRTLNFEAYSLMKRIDEAGVPRFSFQTTSAAGVNAVADSTTAATINKFYHLVGTYDGQKTSLYVNGKLENSANAAFSLDYGNRPLFLGASGESYFEGKLKGALDEVSLYSRALSATEVAALYQASSFGKCTNDLAAPPCFLAPLGSAASWTGNGSGKDLIGSNDLRLNAVTFEDGISGQAFGFNAPSGSYLSPPDSPAFHNKSFTFEGWFNFSNPAKTQVLLYKGIGAGDAPVTASFTLQYYENGRLIAFAGGPEGAIVILDYSWTPKAGDWHHLAFTVDDAIAQEELFLDGRLVSSRTGISGRLAYDSHPTVFGVYGDGRFGFTGRMDDLSFYSQVLSPGEIRAIFEAGGTGKCPSAPVQVVTITTPGPQELAPLPPGLDLVLQAQPAIPTDPPVDAKVAISNGLKILRATLGAAPGSTLELIVNALLEAHTIEVTSGGQLVVQGRIIGDVENIAGIVSRDPVITSKLKSLGSLVEENKALIDSFGLTAIVSMIQPEITRVFAAFPAGARQTARSIHADELTATVGGIPIDGDYTQDGRGILAIAIQGTNFVSGGTQQYDRLEVTGTATLSGQIGFGLLNASGETVGDVFQPPLGAVFDVVVASQVIANNLTVRGPIWGSGLQFYPVIAQFSDGRESLRLIATNVAPVLEIRAAASGFHVVFATNYLGRYVLEAAPALSTAAWREVPGTTVPFQIPNAERARFFRMRKVQ